MRQLISLFLISFCAITSTKSQSSLSFNSLSDVFEYADNHSTTFKNATQLSIVAKYQTLAAKLSLLNLKSEASFTATDNTKLPVSFLPAEIFGGQPGTFKQITLGQKYLSVFNVAPQFDILNPYAAALIKESRVNEKLASVNNQLTKKNLYESVAAAYYNIVSNQWQIKITQKSLANSDTLAQILKNKLDEGVARSQDVNNAMANQLAIQDKLQQLQIQLIQQLNSLKLLVDIGTETNVTITEAETGRTNFDPTITANGNLQQLQSEWQLKYQQADLDANKKWFLPKIGLVSSFSWQQYTNNHFFDNSQFLSTNYVGAKLTVPLVPAANNIAAVKYDRINIITAKNNVQHAALQDSINNLQTILDYKKAFNSYNLSIKIEALKEDSYRKNLNIYQEGILSTTDLLISFNDWLNNSLNTVVQLANSQYAKSKIMISNTVK